MCFLEFFEALIGCALIHPGSKYYNTYVKRPKTMTSEHSLGSQPSILSVRHSIIIVKSSFEYLLAKSSRTACRQSNIRISKYHCSRSIWIDSWNNRRSRKTSISYNARYSYELNHHSVLNFRFWVVGTNGVVDTSSLNSFAAKLDDFFHGIFLPAAAAFDQLREQIRRDEEKTWQGGNPETSQDDKWPKQYAVIVWCDYFLLFLWLSLFLYHSLSIEINSRESSQINVDDL